MRAIILKKKKSFLRVESASINFVPQKKYTRRFALEYNKTSTAFSAKTAMKITTITSIANSANKFTRIVARTRMTTSGSDATIAKDG